MLASLITTPINHVLRSEGWACKRLQSFVDQTICIQIPPFVNFIMRINAQGEVQPVNNSICADTTLTISSFILAKILTGESTVFQLIKITGNQSLAEELINIGRQINLSMIFEHDLSKIMGDIPAHRITNTGEHFMRWQTENFDHLSQALVEYWTEENSFLTKSSAINQFIEEVKNLQLITEQLEQRLNRLSQRNIPVTQ